MYFSNFLKQLNAIEIMLELNDYPIEDGFLMWAI
jgi:hypothetical protein